MNSEVPQNPQSDTNQPVESVEIQAELDSSEIKPKSEQLPDIWLSTPETVEGNDANSEQKSATESEAWLDEAVIESKETSPSEPAEDTSDQSPTESTTESEAWLDEAVIESKETSPPESAEDTSEQSPTESATESELFTDRWLDQSQSVTEIKSTEKNLEPTITEIKELEHQKAALINQIETLKAQKDKMMLQQVREVQETMGRMVEAGMQELKERKSTLQMEIEKLERRQERIKQEMRTTFAGSSQELAVRVQGFKEYLVGSLQDLATAAERLELSRAEIPTPPKTRERERERDRGQNRGRERERSVRGRTNSAAPPTPQFAESAFMEQAKRIRKLLEQYRNKPDYYGSPWQLRRTFDPIHAEKVQEWFFSQGGRGAIDSIGSRLQNILVASAIISVLHHLYGDRCRILVLIDTPEKLGEWRRGLQDCLGISRSDFGSNRGIVLFDSAEILVQRAERLVKDKLLPLIVIDETDELVNLSLLKFPLWLAFASGAKPTSSNYLY